MSLIQFLGLDKLGKLMRMVKAHGGIKASLYHFYLTDDLKVSGLSFRLCLTCFGSRVPFASGIRVQLAEKNFCSYFYMTPFSGT